MNYSAVLLSAIVAKLTGALQHRDLQCHITNFYLYKDVCPWTSARRISVRPQTFYFILFLFLLIIIIIIIIIY
jgi:hypothetical protein